MKLADYLTTEKISQGEFARRIGATAGAVCRWIAGERFPNRIYRKRILKATDGKVSVEDFE